MYIGHPGSYISEDLVDFKGSVGHDGDADRSLRRSASWRTSPKAPLFGRLVTSP